MRELALDRVGMSQMIVFKVKSRPAKTTPAPTPDFGESAGPDLSPCQAEAESRRLQARPGSHLGFFPLSAACLPEISIVWALQEVGSEKAAVGQYSTALSMWDEAIGLHERGSLHECRAQVWWCCALQ